MTNNRMIPPAGGPATASGRANGRTYICASGSTIDVPDFDSSVLEAQGWVIAALAGAGTTATRPAANSVKAGAAFHDTTLGYNIVSDGKTWRNPTNGGAV